MVDGFFGASPELLVGRRSDVVYAHPLAGTLPRSTDPDRDRALALELLSSDKNRWEHKITIDWLLDNLLPFCSYVDAEPQPSIVSLANVHHLGTKVEGRLSSPSASVLELIDALHPTPAVGGDPQKAAIDLIAEIERADRARYAGPTGWVDGAGNGEFAVSVRSAQFERPDRVRLFAGVGVVADSELQAELDETRAKFQAILGALIQP
jgi:menaquinone-specific isochorismate synthase